MKTGYKGTCDFICINHKFEIGQIYELPNKPIICEYGFHYCLNPIDVLNYYPINPKFRLLEIEDLSDDTVIEEDKSVTNKIRIIREVPKEEYRPLMGFFGNELKIDYYNDYWMKYQYDERNNCILYETSHGYWVKHQYDERNNCIYRENNDGFWEKRQFDERNNWTYKEDNFGKWSKRQFDERNNEVFYEDSFGYSIKYQYDENNQIIDIESGSKLT